MVLSMNKPKCTFKNSCPIKIKRQLIAGGWVAKNGSWYKNDIACKWGKAIKIEKSKNKND
jgi:hypothetical protein